MFCCYRGVIPYRQVLVMGTIVTWEVEGREGGEKKSREKAVTPKKHKCQLLGRVAFTPESHHWQLTVPWLNATHVTAPRAAQSLVVLYEKRKSPLATVFSERERRKNQHYCVT